METHSKDILERLTFDDVLLVPAFSAMCRDEWTLHQLTRNRFDSTSLVSAAMDTVTEARTAISMAQEGGWNYPSQPACCNTGTGSGLR